MNLIVYLYAIVLIAVKGIQGLKSSKFLRGNINVEKVCAGNYRVFTRVGVPSATKCVNVCSETIECDAIFFSAVNGSCTGCRKLTDLSSALVAAAANVYYQLVNANFSEWQYGTSRYFFDVSKKMNYSDAKVYCQLFDAHVVVPDSQDEQNFLNARLSNTPTGVSWAHIGIINLTVVEHSGKTVNYTYWDQEQGEPTKTENQKCTTFWRGRKWHDGYCSNVQDVVCEHD
ncbi:hypothetical protein DPMN_099726 [Dreissena polymorpha]|uniref:C-type lectin domain-containing protein n=1 Tax=Dreissena polymorpha TaxID=45954 RepID=A0A9D4LHT6_DREPO|nr:hypothetical protein DPMN_099726 [Dreissena polymorpha]